MAVRKAWNLALGSNSAKMMVVRKVYNSAVDSNSAKKTALLMVRSLALDLDSGRTTVAPMAFHWKLGSSTALKKLLVPVWAIRSELYLVLLLIQIQRPMNAWKRGGSVAMSVKLLHLTAWDFYAWHWSSMLAALMV
jgi:hypothetical protein